MALLLKSDFLDLENTLFLHPQMFLSRGSCDLQLDAVASLRMSDAGAVQTPQMMKKSIVILDV